MTSRQRSQTFRELVADLYVHGVRLRGGAATLWRNVQAVALWRPTRRRICRRGSRGTRPGCPSVAPSVRWPWSWGRRGERLDLRLSGPGFDGTGWFAVLAARGVQGLTTDDDPVYGPALEAAGLDRQPGAVPRQRTVGRHIRGLDEDDLTHLDRVLLPILRRRARVRTPEAGPVREPGLQPLQRHLSRGGTLCGYGPIDFNIDRLLLRKYLSQEGIRMSYRMSLSHSCAVGTDTGREF